MRRNTINDASFAPRRRPRLSYSIFCGITGFIYANNIIGTRLSRIRSNRYSFFTTEDNIHTYMGTYRDFPGGSDGKASAYNAGDPGLILGQGDPLEKEMATHSSALAWKIPWTEEPGRL